MISLAVVESRCENNFNCTLIEAMNPQNEFKRIISVISSLRTAQKTLTMESLQSRSNVKVLFWNLSGTCRRYTDVMAFKDQLQKQLFNNATEQDDVLLSITSLIITLQTAAMKLQSLEIGLTAQFCVTFNSEQYKLIYISRLDIDGKKGLIRSLRRAALKWQNKINLCKNWENYY